MNCANPKLISVFAEHTHLFGIFLLERYQFQKSLDLLLTTFEYLKQELQIRGFLKVKLRKLNCERERKNY